MLFVALLGSQTREKTLPTTTQTAVAGGVLILELKDVMMSPIINRNRIKTAYCQALF